MVSNAINELIMKLGFPNVVDFDDQVAFGKRLWM